MLRTEVMDKRLNCVLLIDDDEPTNVLHQIILEEVGIVKDIQVAQSGYEGIDYLKSCLANINNIQPRLPELIFLDINMPGMNGFEFLDEYRKLGIEEQEEVKIIMLTTSLNPDDEEKSKLINEVSSYQNKPLTENMVTQIFNQLFA